MHAAFWFRRDLRLEDNTGLFHALRSGLPVIPVFIFDRDILDPLPRQDARVEFIHQALSGMQQQLAAAGSSLVVRHGTVQETWQALLEQYPGIRAVYTNHDYEPYARSRDAHLEAWFRARGIAFHTFRDQVLFEKEELLSGSGKAYSVFTPYSRKWKDQLAAAPERLDPQPAETLMGQYWQQPAQPLPSLAELGFSPAGIAFPPPKARPDTIREYHERRNFPAQPGTTRLGLHLRFGTISLRQLARTALELNETYLNELIWREFYMQILWNFPHVARQPFRPEYEAIAWRNSEAEFEKWKTGRTGYPLVDAGMRELSATGYMHNRVRMVTASFLSKHLLIDWRWGEAWFAEKLLDFELASNNGGWQWAAGSGTDAAPYFRIFNPEEQLKKFDPEARYVRAWVPEYGTPLYPRPVVDHKLARERCLAAYQRALKGAGEPFS